MKKKAKKKIKLRKVWLRSDVHIYTITQGNSESENSCPQRHGEKEEKLKRRNGYNVSKYVVVTTTLYLKKKIEEKL